jgi:hypothetical protein
MFAGRSAVELATNAIAQAVITTWVDLISGTPFARRAREAATLNQEPSRNEAAPARTGAEEKNLLSYIDNNERRYQRRHESTNGSPHASRPTAPR